MPELCSRQSEDIQVDVLVVGSGNGGLTAALCAHELGVKNVLVIEKSDKYGGTSATSGGCVWIACNRYAREAGAQDTIENARQFLQEAIPPTAVSTEMLDTYLREGPRMLDFLHERTRVRYRTLAQLPGAKHLGDMFLRSMEPEPVYLDVLGAEYQSLRDAHRMHWVLDRILMTLDETLTMFTRPPGWRSVLAKIIWDYVSDVPWVLTHRRSRRLACGPAGIARLRGSMLDRGMPLWLNAQLKDLLTDDGGRVVGATVFRDGKRIIVRSRYGVVLAAGGFEHNQAMRERYLPKPTSFEWSAAVETNTGDGIRAAVDVGAATRLMNSGQWCGTFKTPDHPVPWLARAEKMYSGSCVVNQRGRRIANESYESITYQNELFSKHSEADPQVPTWLVFDARFRRSYFVGPLYNARLRPDWVLPKLYFSSGFLTRARTIRELAEKAGIDPPGLERTVAAMNEYARTGKDLEFRRGEAEHDRFFADPAIKPNPCLAPIAESPFYAMRIEPGDFGTNGGLATDTDARVLRSGGEPIPGLYAVGNCAAAMAVTYPAPGLSLGPAMVFAWQAAQHIARTSAGPSSDCQQFMPDSRAYDLQERKR